MTTIIKPYKSAVTILEEIENGLSKNWTIAEKALNIDSLEISKEICMKIVSDGDRQQSVRVELSSYHERIHKALLIAKNQPAIVPYTYREVRYPVKVQPEIEDRLDFSVYFSTGEAFFYGFALLSILYFTLR